MPNQTASQLLASEGNVSSAQLDQQEIDDIASELKKSLTTTPQTANVPVATAPAEEIEEESSAPAGLLRVNPQAATDAVSPDDTIYIDNEGVFHNKDAAEASDVAPKA